MRLLRKVIGARLGEAAAGGRPRLGDRAVVTADDLVSYKCPVRSDQWPLFPKPFDCTSLQPASLLLWPPSLVCSNRPHRMVWGDFEELKEHDDETNFAYHGGDDCRTVGREAGCSGGGGGQDGQPGLALSLARGPVVVLDARRQLDGVDRLDLDPL